MINKILQAINLAGYDYKAEDIVEIKMLYLLDLRKEVLNLRDEIDRLKKECKVKDYEIKRLTGKLIEKDLERKSIDIYM